MSTTDISTGPRATAGLALWWASAVVYRRSFIVMLYLHLQVILTVAGETPVHQRVLLVVLWSCCHRAPYTRQTETTDYFIKNGIHKNQKEGAVILVLWLTIKLLHTGLFVWKDLLLMPHMNHEIITKKYVYFITLYIYKSTLANIRSEHKKRLKPLKRLQGLALSTPTPLRIK